MSEQLVYSTFKRLKTLQTNVISALPVLEADGNARPCFFHDVIGNIRDTPLDKILNSKTAIDFRKNLDVHSDSTCVKCVCVLNLSPFAKLS